MFYFYFNCLLHNYLTMKLPLIIAVTSFVNVIQSSSVIVPSSSATENTKTGQWVLEWSDEFDGNQVNQTNWNVYADVYEGINQIELYTANNVWVNNSNLVLRTHLENVTINGTTYNVTSGRVDSSFKYNVTVNSRVEVRAMLQADVAIGIHTAAWLLGYGCWPVTAEVDIFEFEVESPEWIRSTSNYHYGTTCRGDIHHPSGSYPDAPYGQNPVNFSNTYHIFAVEWNETSLVFYVNDTAFNSYSSKNITIPNWDMFIIFSQAYMAARRANVPDYAWPVYQYIDYVRVYKWENSDNTAIENGDYPSTIDSVELNKEQDKIDINNKEEFTNQNA